MSPRLATVGSTLLFLSLCTSSSILSMHGVDMVLDRVDASVPTQIAERDVNDKTTRAWTTRSTIDQPDIVVSTVVQEIIESKTVDDSSPTTVVETFLTTVTVKNDDEESKTVTQTLSKTPRCRWANLDALNACLHQSENCQEGDWECKCHRARKRESCFRICEDDDRHAEHRRIKHQACNHAYAVPSPRLLKPTLTREVIEPYTLTVVRNKHGVIQGSKTVSFRRKVLQTKSTTFTVLEYPKGIQVTAWTGKKGHTHIPQIMVSQVQGNKVFETVNARTHKSGNSPSLVVPGIAVMAGGALGVLALAL